VLPCRSAKDPELVLHEGDLSARSVDRFGRRDELVGVVLGNNMPHLIGIIISLSAIIHRHNDPIGLCACLG
jgi:hypothetical protein